MARRASQKMPLRLVGLSAGLLIALALITYGFTLFQHNGGEADAPYSPPKKVFNAEDFTLSNGLQVIVIPNHRAPVVTHMVWYKVGAADEATGESGIAHFLEHLMFKGGAGLAPGEFSETVRALGGNDNAFTTQDYTAYFQSIAKEHLPTVMRMEASRMRGLLPPAADVESERAVVIEERRQRTDNDVSSRFTEQMRALLHINHPYGTPVIGWMHEIEKLNWDEAKDFYDHHYGPNNAVLIVTGDVTGDEVYKLAEQIYGAVPRIEVPDRTRTVSPPLIGNPTLTHTDARVHQAVVQTIYRVSSTAQDQKTSLALQVLEDIMGGGPTARLYQDLVVNRKIASAVDFSYSSTALNSAELWVMAYPAEGVDADTVAQALDDALRKVIADGVTEKEVNAAITRLQDDAVFARDSLSGPAMIIGREVLSGATLDYVERWPHLIGEVTKADIQAAAARYLNPDSDGGETVFVRGILTPKDSGEASGEIEKEPALAEETL